MLEFNSSIYCGEPPIGFGVVSIAVVLPSGNFFDQGLLVGDTAAEALGRQDAEFGFRQIKPAAMLGGVVPLEAFDQPPGFGRRKSLVE